MEVNNPDACPAQNEILAYHEQVVNRTVICPQDCIGTIHGLCAQCRGEQQSFENVNQTWIKMDFVLPLIEIGVNFFDRLKSATFVHGLFDYEDAVYQETILPKVDILVNEKPVDQRFVTHASKA